MKYLLVLTLLATSAAHAENTKRLNIDIGKGNVNLDQQYEFGDNSIGHNSWALGLSFGIITTQNITYDFGVLKASDDLGFGWGDNINWTSYEANVGYLFRNGQIYVEPKLGLARWNIEAEEGMLLNPGDEERRSDSGFDLLFELTVGVQLYDMFGLSLSYKHQDFDLGDTDFAIIGLDYRL